MLEIVRDIKAKCTYVALDYDSELQKVKHSSECDITYNLPDGNVITINDQRFRCPELLFKPLKNGFELDGIDQTIYNSIMKCNIGARKDFYSNIFLYGGCTLFEGLPERIEKEINIYILAPPTIKTTVFAPQERKYSAWIGGSIFASLPDFPNRVIITQDEYNQKCC